MCSQTAEDATLSWVYSLLRRSSDTPPVPAAVPAAVFGVRSLSERYPSYCGLPMQHREDYAAVVSDKAGPTKRELKRRKAEGRQGHADPHAEAEEEEDDDHRTSIGAAEAISAQYFHSYADLSVHRTMLNDRPRMEFYRSVLSQRPAIEGKIVLDAGAGTGVLSFFAAVYGGAKHVIAVEASPQLCEGIRSTLAKHHDRSVAARITVVNAQLEEITYEALRKHLPTALRTDPSFHVDIIVSEWMGFYLYHERMLQSVLKCRDRLVYDVLMDGDAAKDVIQVKLPAMVPSHCSLHVGLVDMAPLKTQVMHRWDVAAEGHEPLLMHGFGHLEWEALMSAAPVVEQLPPECILPIKPSLFADTPLPSATAATPPLVPCHNFQCREWALEAPELSAKDIDNFIVDVVFPCGAAVAVPAATATVWGVCIWFEVHNRSVGAPMTLRTGPKDAPTHWKQTAVLLPVENHLLLADLITDNASFGVRLEFSCAEGQRCYALGLELFDGEGGPPPVPESPVSPATERPDSTVTTTTDSDIVM